MLKLAVQKQGAALRVLNLETQEFLPTTRVEITPDMRLRLEFDYIHWQTIPPEEV